MKQTHKPRHFASIEIRITSLPEAALPGEMEYSWCRGTASIDILGILRGLQGKRRHTRAMNTPSLPFGWGCVGEPGLSTNETEAPRQWILRALQGKRMHIRAMKSASLPEVVALSAGAVSARRVGVGLVQRRRARRAGGARRVRPHPFRGLRRHQR